METGFISTETPGELLQKTEDITQAPDKNERVTSNINPPKRIRPEKQNNKKEVFDQSITGSSVSSSKPASLFCLVMFTLAIKS